MNMENFKKYSIMDETPSIATDSTGSNTVLSPVPIFCDYCGKEIIGQPIIGVVP